MRILLFIVRQLTFFLDQLGLCEMKSKNSWIIFMFDLIGFC